MRITPTELALAGIASGVIVALASLLGTHISQHRIALRERRTDAYLALLTEIRRLSQRMDSLALDPLGKTTKELAFGVGTDPAWHPTITAALFYASRSVRQRINELDSSAGAFWACHFATEAAATGNPRRPRPEDTLALLDAATQFKDRAKVLEQAMRREVGLGEDP